ncbi:NAD(P)/FAD-dependent oxidoreductase [Agaribacterium haliotis]|uniref:NAD(P)/FAD-dependent oxidoreductase n=1 Tax=Agaribacterium haliotis TaxID=2013869 RepID=UPI000BB5930D|nr:FAD-dependent oxidoreductase [Agaribacterium haliotis]
MSAHSTSLPSLVIVGNGMVAGRLLDELLERQNRDGAKHYEITVIGAEPHGSYNRIMLSSVLAKDTSVKAIVQKDHDWYQSKGIRFISGSPVTAIEREAKWVETACGQRVSYDELVLATGSRAARIPAENLDLNNIFLFRTIADTEGMMQVAAGASSAVVVGGGLLGLEAAYGLAKFGIKVTLVHRSGWLLNRQLDKQAGAMLKTVMQDMGIEFCLGDEIASFREQNGSVCGARLKSGRELRAELAVVATGITPNAELGLEHGLNGQRAIDVDDFMQSSAANISALGECIEHRGATFGLVDPLWRQAETLAARLVNRELVPFENQAIATKLKVSGVQVFSAGQVQEQAGQRAVVIEDKQARIYRKLIIDQGRIVGVVLFGDVRSGAHYFDLMQAGKNVSADLPQLIFGQEFAESPGDKELAA